MIGVIILILLCATEVGFMVYQLLTKTYQKDKKSIYLIALFILFSVLIIVEVVKWSFRWYFLFILLFIKTLTGIWYLFRRRIRKEKTYKIKYVIISSIGNVLLIILATLPSILFPQFKPLQPTGSYKIETVSYTLTDPNRIETFSNSKENRTITIQFWYPQNGKGKYPLTVFSHGAFGYRGSNRSTYEDLASHGYVVCSIDHTYHAFMVKQTDGKTILANENFINDAMSSTNGDYSEQKTYKLSHDWLKLRIDDVNFVLSDTLNKSTRSDSDQVYHLINSDKIGLFGHSLGGATAAELGRERSDIDAVIDIDGTMFGEAIDFKNGNEIFNTTPYPIPLLNIYNEEHYKEALKHTDSYANMVATKGAVDARTIVFKGAGHLNFTDLPIFSPYLASLLGTGNIDSHYCIKTLNHIVLEYFNYYLKDSKKLKLKVQY